MPTFVPRAFSRACLKTFRQSEDGAGTTYSLFTLAVMALLGGYAIDVSNVMTDRTNMQTSGRCGGPCRASDARDEIQ